MISIFNKTETNFTHNGLGNLDDYLINPVVTEELNGIFMLEFDYQIHAPHSDELLPEMIVRAPVPDMVDQLFRISERSDALGARLHIVAYHIFYDLAKNLIEDTYLVNKTGAGALTQMLSATQFAHSFTSSSNILTANNARLVRLNPVEILLDDGLDNGFLARWGGEIIRDNFHVSMNNTRGSDNGVQIRDKKNLTGYQADVDYSGIVTRIMPEGADGIFLPEKYVDSHHINNYVTPKIKVIKYDVEIGENEGEFTQAQAFVELRRLAALEYSVNHVDLPNATYDVEFAPLERTEEYKYFSSLETINIGDKVTVIHEEDGLNISARMVSYQYNPATKSYIKITLGNVMPKFTDVSKDIKRAAAKAERAVDDANYALTSANGKNTNFYGTADPVNPRLGDIWYKENGDKLEMWVYENRDGNTQWYPYMTDLTQEEVKQAVEIAHAESAEAVAKANQAFDDATAALATAENADINALLAYDRSIKSSLVSYTTSTDSANVPTTGWQDTVPQTQPGEYLWARTIITLQDDSQIKSYNVSKHGETGEDAYRVEIFSTDGNVFKNGSVQTILQANLFKGDSDITDEIDANCFKWERVSEDNSGDIIWNAAHFGGTKTITVTKDDINKRATFSCSVEI